MNDSLNANPRAVARNAASGYVALALGALLGFVLTPLLLRHLGTTGFGIWSLILGTLGYLSVLEAGLPTASTTRVAATEAEGPQAMSRVLSTSFTLLLWIGVGTIPITLVLSVVFPLLFDVPRELVGDARVAIFLIGAWQVVSFGILVYTAALLGTGRMYLLTVNACVVLPLASIAQAAVLIAGGGLRALAAVQLAGACFTIGLLRRQVRRALPAVRISLGGFHRSTAKRLFDLGWRNSIVSVASLLAFGSDVVLVGLLIDAKAAASYAIALRGYALLQRLSTGVLNAIAPAHAYAANNSSTERRFQLYCTATFVTLCLATYAALTVAMFAFPLLHLWLGSVPESAPSILLVLCAVLILQAPGLNAASVMVNSEQAGQLMKVTVTTAAFNVAASIVFTLTVGSIGPALGSLAAVAVADSVYLPHRICRMLGQPYSELAKRVLLPLVLPVCLLLFILTLGKVLIPPGPWVLAIAASGAVLFFGALWHLPAGRSLRLLLRGNDLAAA